MDDDHVYSYDPPKKKTLKFRFTRRKFQKLLSSKKIIVSLFGLLLLLAGFTGGMSLIRKDQDIREEAQISGDNQLTQASFTLTNVSGAMIDTDSRADGAPTAMDDNGVWKVWNCSSTPGDSSDSILYTSFNSSGAKLSSSKMVLGPTYKDSDPWGRGSCAPTVVKFQNIYRMYYECVPRVYDKRTNNVKGCYNEVCTAISSDGVNWTRGPVVFPINDKIKQNISLETKYDRLFADYDSPGSCNDLMINYGTGQPSAIVKDNQIWLWYTDSRGEWAQGGTFLAKSSDGVNFSNPELLPNKTPAFDIKYLPQFDAYIGTMDISGHNRFAYSKDGINWSWSEFQFVNNAWEIKYPNLTIGEGKNEYCAVPGQPAILGNPQGYLQGLSGVRIFSPEGYMGKYDSGQSLGCYNSREDSHRGSTWAIYLLQGNFNIPYFQGGSVVATLTPSANPLLTPPPIFLRPTAISAITPTPIRIPTPTITALPTASPKPTLTPTPTPVHTPTPTSIGETEAPSLNANPVIETKQLPPAYTNIEYSFKIITTDTDPEDNLRLYTQGLPTGYKITDCQQYIVSGKKVLTCTLVGNSPYGMRARVDIVVTDGVGGVDQESVILDIKSLNFRSNIARIWEIISRRISGIWGGIRLDIVD